MQNKVIYKIKNIDFKYLAQVEKYLDIIEDLKDYIDNSDINNIERCKVKMLSLFDLCQNNEYLRADITLINSAFTNILENK